MYLISRLDLNDRFISFSEIPAFVALDLGNGISGVIKGLGATLMLGTNNKLNVSLNKHFSEFDRVISDLYLCVLGVINPKDLKSSKKVIDGLDNHHVLSTSKNLFFRDKFVNLINNAGAVLDQEKFFEREVLLRSYTALMLIGSVAARVADAALGIIATFSSLVMFGTSSQLNVISFKQLQAVPGVVSDIFAFTIYMINPKADFE